MATSPSPVAIRLALCVFTAAGCGGDMPPPPGPAHAVLPVEEGVLRIAGSGALIPLAKALGSAYGRIPGGLAFHGSWNFLGPTSPTRVVLVPYTNISLMAVSSSAWRRW